jgi:hypothetical protein
MLFSEMWFVNADRSVNKDQMVAALSHLSRWFLAVLSVGACQKYEPIASQSPYTHHKIIASHFGAQQEFNPPSHTFHSQTFPAFKFALTVRKT